MDIRDEFIRNAFCRVGITFTFDIFNGFNFLWGLVLNGVKKFRHKMFITFTSCSTVSVGSLSRKILFPMNDNSSINRYFLKNSKLFRKYLKKLKYLFKFSKTVKFTHENS